MKPKKTPVTLLLSHGGSGPGGNSWWAKRATGCLEKTRLQDRHSAACENFYKPSKAGPNAMLIGSLFHLLAECETKGLFDPDVNEPVFFDKECDWTPPQDAIDEALRVYHGWRKVRESWGEGTLIGAELHLTAELAPDIEAAALIDQLVIDPDGILCLEDLKTSNRSGDNHTRGKTRLQLQLYTMVAWANGYDVQRIRVRQIVKNKAVKEEIFTVDLPSPLREEWILRYLEGAKGRSEQPEFGPRGDECDFCPFGQEFGDGSCTL